MKYIKSKSAINPSKMVQLNVTMMCDSPSSTSNKPKLFQLKHVHFSTSYILCKAFPKNEEYGERHKKRSIMENSFKSVKL
jgi:hypothetical protein